ILPTRSTSAMTTAWAKAPLCAVQTCRVGKRAAPKPRPGTTRARVCPRGRKSQQRTAWAKSRRCIFRVERLLGAILPTLRNYGKSARQFWVAVGLLWLAGVGLRLTILAVPPVITRIAADLHLSGTEIGILSGLPTILFAAAAMPGSLLIARFGALPTLMTGLL